MCPNQGYRGFAVGLWRTDLLHTNAPETPKGVAALLLTECLAGDAKLYNVRKTLQANTDKLAKIILRFAFVCVGLVKMFFFILTFQLISSLLYKEAVGSAQGNHLLTTICG